MMKKLFIFFTILFCAVNVNAANTAKKCIVKDNTKIDSNYVIIEDYKKDANFDYKGRKTYSSIKCQRYLELETPGEPKNVASNPENIYSGIGFSYGPIKVKEVYSCVGTIQYAKIACAYNEEKNSGIKKALKQELEAYKEWTNTKMENYIKNIANSKKAGVVPVVKIDMTEEEMTAEVKNRMAVNENTEFENKGYKVESVQDSKIEKVSESDIDKKKRSKVELWQRKYTIERWYYPDKKQIILDGDREGEVLSLSKSCPGGYTCKALEGNKVYTDFLMSAGVHDLKVTATQGGKSITSTCGYVIYNKGVSGWYDFLNYRQVDPSNPFPSGPNELWLNKIGLFGKEFKNSPLTVFSLDASKIPQVRKYNNRVGSYKSKKASNSAYSSDFLQQYSKYYNPAVLKG